MKMNAFTIRMIDIHAVHSMSSQEGSRCTLDDKRSNDFGILHFLLILQVSNEVTMSRQWLNQVIAWEGYQMI